MTGTSAVVLPPIVDASAAATSRQLETREQLCCLESATKPEVPLNPRSLSWWTRFNGIIGN